jgi:hypothetical protein
MEDARTDDGEHLAALVRETVDDLEKREVPTVQEDGSGGVSFFENNDLFLCEGCKNPHRVGGSD